MIDGFFVAYYPRHGVMFQEPGQGAGMIDVDMGEKHIIDVLYVHCRQVLDQRCYGIGRTHVDQYGRPAGAKPGTDEMGEARQRRIGFYEGDALQKNRRLVCLMKS